jgi:hypothetical protein
VPGFGWMKFHCGGVEVRWMFMIVLSGPTGPGRPPTMVRGWGHPSPSFGELAGSSRWNVG